MKRTKLSDRELPDYTGGEEILNTVSHSVGAVLGVLALIFCLIRSVNHQNVWAIVGSTIYGSSLIWLYTMSSVYHGVTKPMPKKVLQILDHCTIYFLICGSYTPILLCSIRLVSPLTCWLLFSAIWGIAVIAIVFTAIDLKKYAVFSMVCYIGLGWSVVFAIKPTLQALPMPAIIWLLAGGIAYTVGAVMYGFGSKYRYIHSVFHIFVLLGSILQFIAIYEYVI